MSGPPLSQSEPAGNTKTAGNNQLYRWIFTIPLEDIEVSQLSQTLKEISKKFIFQGEQGESGYKHWQGCFTLKIKERFTTVKNHLPHSTHLEPIKNWWQSIKYCSKKETRIEGPYDENSVFVKIIKNLRPWQKKIIDIISEEPNDRTIHWVYDQEGNNGKTVLCKYMAQKHKAEIFNNACNKDIAYALSEEPKICLFDFSRSLEEYVNYGVLESVKNGLIFSGKYESRTKIFNPPHVIIFANFEPDLSKMSKDRWNIITL